MNMKTTNRNQQEDGKTTKFAKACLASCRKLLARVEETKTAIMTEFREAVGEDQRLLQLALNEAEGLAWQTEYPHLLFPALATEKAQAAVAWHARQQSMFGNVSELAHAA